MDCQHSQNFMFILFNRLEDKGNLVPISFFYFNRRLNALVFHNPTQFLLQMKFLLRGGPEWEIPDSCDQIWFESTVTALTQSTSSLTKHSLSNFRTAQMFLNTFHSYKTFWLPLLIRKKSIPNSNRQLWYSENPTLSYSLGETDSGGEWKKTVRIRKSRSQCILFDRFV